MKKSLKNTAMLLASAMCMSAAVNAAAAGFTDIAETDYFAPAVDWGVEQGITTGTDETHFDPDGEVSRAQIVTFLWRKAGMPTPTATETFSDVPAGSWYETAVQWAVENGITLGTGEGKFSPDDTCSRAMCITLLYRAENSPLDSIDFTTPVDAEASDITLEELGVLLIQQFANMIHTENIFPDVPENSYYDLPVIWATMSGVITEDNTGKAEPGMKFRSDDPCVRKEMISFLYQTKLIADKANEPMIYEFGSINVPIPQETLPLLYLSVNAIPDDEYGTLITVSERASVDAAKARLGDEDADVEGIGELFSISRESEETVRKLFTSDMSGIIVFAKDTKGDYYVLYHPTDVRLERETTEEMEADLDEWAKLNEWASTTFIDEIIASSKDLTREHYTNNIPDMYIARAGFDKDAKYTISTTEFGPLEPNGVDGSVFADTILRGGFVELENATAPDGEYIVLSFPDDDIRLDFFRADENYLRVVNGETETFYSRSVADDVLNTPIMQGWYNALAEKAGKIEAE